MGMGWPSQQMQPPPAVPAANAGGDAVQMWRMQMEAWAAQQKLQMEMMARFIPVPGAAQPQGGQGFSLDGMFGMFDKFVGFSERIADMRAPAGPDPHGIQIIKPDADTTLIAQDGKIDSFATGGLMLKDALKGVTSALRSRGGASGISGGAHAPKPAGK
jgi:hypothetical protein